MHASSLAKRHILVLDDDTRIRTLLAHYLEQHGAWVSSAANTAEARAILEDFLIDLCVVDVMLPDESGTSFTRGLRANGNRIPILMLTAMGEAQSRIKGLASGADDYLPKPFEPEELLLRITRILERTQPLQISSQESEIRFGALRFSTEKSLLLDGENKPIALTSKELELLALLTENIGKNMSRDELALTCGGVNARSIDVLITRLRNKLEPDPKRPIYLRTIWGEGYSLVSD